MKKINITADLFKFRNYILEDLVDFLEASIKRRQKMIEITDKAKVAKQYSIWYDTFKDWGNNNND